MKNLVRMINNMKLKYKFILFYIVVVMIPVLIIGIALTGYFRGAALDRAIDQATNNLEKIKSQMASKLRVPTDISNLLYFDGDFKTLVTTQYPSILELTKAYINFTDFKDYILQYRELSNIRFFIDNQTLVDNMSIAPLTPEIESRSWYQKVVGTKGIHWLYIPDKEKYETSEKGTINKLSLIRQVPYSEYKNPVY